MSKRKVKLPADAPGRIGAVGTWLWGTTYRRKMAEAMGISRDTLWGWLRGSAKPHHDIDGRLLDLLESERDACAERGIQITALRKQLIARKAS